MPIEDVFEGELDVKNGVEKTQAEMVANNAIQKMTIDGLSEGDALKSVLQELGDTLVPGLQDQAAALLKERLAEEKAAAQG